MPLGSCWYQPMILIPLMSQFYLWWDVDSIYLSFLPRNMLITLSIFPSCQLKSSWSTKLWTLGTDFLESNPIYKPENVYSIPFIWGPYVALCYSFDDNYCFPITWNYSHMSRLYIVSHLCTKQFSFNFELGHVTSPLQKVSWAVLHSSQVFMSWSSLSSSRI